jgi:predicted TIM-barrel fold metal-dependent hydrolase
MIGGRRVRTIDTHAHGFVREVVPIVKDQEWASILLSADSGERGNRITPDFIGPERVAWMDENGVDVQMVSINPYWFVAERGIVAELIPAQNEALAANAAKFPGRFAPWAGVALQFPELAAQQLDEAVKKYNMPGAAIAVRQPPMASRVRRASLADRSARPTARHGDWTRPHDLRRHVRPFPWPPDHRGPWRRLPAVVRRPGRLLV